MIKTSAIRSPNKEAMSVTWDTGRRCNYDCTYCESTRHDLVSQYHSLDELKNTYHFIKEWTHEYNRRRKENKGVNIVFTGGEPTINPNFWDLVEYIKKDSPSFNLQLTTNGTWGPSYREKVLNYLDCVTISWHAEGQSNLKQRAIDNILHLSNSEIVLQVNLMLHADYWDEAMDVCKLLDDNNVRYNPRPIGDGNITRVGWFIDADGTNRRTSHTYSQEQQEWFFNKMGVSLPGTSKAEGNQLGRGCCGGRCLEAKVDDQWQTVKLVNTEFKDWHCMVDWFFLHIDQHTGLVYHHQTCQALHNQKRGALGHLDDREQLLLDLRSRLSNPSPIICPNQRCGCGMCVPKARDADVFKILWQDLTDVQARGI